MVKKKVKKIKSKEFHFKDFNLNKKIISVILIVLAIGVIGSVFPGEGMTGGTVSNTFDSLRGALSGINNIILDVFGTLFRINRDMGNNQIIYAMFVIFSIVVGIVYLIARQFSDNPFINFLISGGFAYLSTFLIPRDAIISTGLLYSSTFMSIILVIPIILLWVIVIRIDKTKIGYIIKCLLLAFMFLLMSTNDLGGAGAAIGGVGEIRAGTGIVVESTRWIVNVSIIAVIVYFMWSFFNIWRASGKDIKKTEKGIQKELGIEAKNTILDQLWKSLKKGKASR